MATNTEVLQAIQKLDCKVENLNDSVVAHHAVDAEKGKILDKLYLDIHGNGKKGMKLEMEELKAWMGGSKKLAWIMVTAAVGSLTGALITILTAMAK